MEETKYLPHRFFKLKKNKKLIVIKEILYDKGEEEIENEATYKRLEEIHQTLEASDTKTDKSHSTKEAPTSMMSTTLLSRSISATRYQKIIKKEYPHRHISNDLLPYIEIKKNDEVQPLNQKVQSLSQAVMQLWNSKENRHVVLIGEGGMGKTTSLIKFWESLLEENQIYPIPVFISLEEYNREDPERKRDFIWYKIAEDYLETIRKEEIIKLKEEICSNQSLKGNRNPSYIFFLDGMNEVKKIDRQLRESFEKIITYPHIQVIISSRSNVNPLFGSSPFTVFTLQNLTNDQIKPFMENEGEPFNEALLDHISDLRNPMMLTLYCEAEREIKQIPNLPNSRIYQFITKPRYKAELFYNYFVSRRVKWDARPATSNGERALHELYFDHLLPKIGHEMEKSNILKIARSELREIINNELVRYQEDAFRDYYERIDEAISEDLEDMKKWLSPERNNINIIIKILRDNEYLLTETNGMLAFHHQDYRDYFAAVHILEQLDAVGIKNFHELHTRIIEPHLRKMICGLQRKSGFKKRHTSHATTLKNAIKELGDRPIGNHDYCLLNVLDMIKEDKNDLSDISFANIDLRRIVLNNVRLAHTRKNWHLHKELWENTRLRAYTFLPQWHSRWINDVCYHPDGGMFVSAGEDGYVKEWRTDTGECLMTYGDGTLEAATCVRYSPDGTKIAAGYKDAVIREWVSMDNGEYWEVYQSNEGHTEEILTICYSYSGNFLASGSKDCSLKIWSTQDGVCKKILLHEGPVRTVEYHPTNEYQLIVGSDPAKERLQHVISLWDIQTETKKQLHGHDETITIVTYSYDGKKLLSGSTDNIIREWDIDTGNCYKSYEGHIDSISSLIWYKYQNIQRIFSAACSENESELDTTIKEWDASASEPKCIQTLQGHTYGITALSAYIDQERRTILSSSYDGTIKEWNLLSGECLRTYHSYSNEVHSVKVLTQGRALSGDKHGTISLWDLTTDSGMCLMTYRGKLQGEVYVTANSDENRILARDMKGGYEIWNIETGECLISAHHKNHFFLGFSPDGMRIISTTDNGEISEWNTLTNKCEQTYNKNNPVGKAVTCLTYHPNGTKFLAAYDNIIHEWNTSIIDTICKSFSLERLRITSTTIEELKEHIDESKADGLYELEGEFSEKELQKILHEFHFDKQEISIIIEKASRVTNYEITQICYNPYGTRVLFAKEADPSVEEWDLISKRQTQKFECPQNVSCICYNKDGSRVAIGNAWIIDEFDVTGGEFLDRYDKHHQKVTSLSYGPGGETLLSAGEDGKIKEWNVMAGAQKKEKKTIDYKFGMLIQGLDLSQRHPDSEISEEEQKILEQYGVTF